MKVLKLSGIALLMAIALTSCTNKKECFCEVVAYEDEYILGVLYEDVFYTERNEIVETGKECYEINETDFSDGTQDLMYDASRYYFNCQEF